jgi:phospholipid/cholesterol/gamma-HCH transport system substrate-binding protein
MMEPKREQALVGLFVLVAGGVLVATVFAITGSFGPTAKTYHAYFPFAGGLEPGAIVRYSGGPKIGRVEQLRINPQDPGLIDVTFSVKPDLPVKTDSKVKIMSMSPLGDNHLELLPGTAQASFAPAGSLLGSENYIDFNALTEQLNRVAPQAQQLIQTLDDRATELKVTLDRVNDLLSPQNRSNLAATLADTRGLIRDTRPQLHSTLDHVTALTDRVQPLIQDLRKTSDEADQVLTHIDELVGDNRADVRQAVIQLRGTLKQLTSLTGRLDQNFDVNSENIDALLDNLLRITENFKEFTATIKARPYTLIRATNPREHKPGEHQ